MMHESKFLRAGSKERICARVPQPMAMVYDGNIPFGMRSLMNARAGTKAGCPPWRPHVPFHFMEKESRYVITIHTWYRRRISNGGPSNRPVVFAYSNNAGKRGSAVRR